MRKLACAAVAALVVASSAPHARADEGMWPFNSVPREQIRARYGFEVTDAWLRKVQLASVRFNSGGSGSFVSPDGLVMTNHHVAADTLGKISTPDRDYFKTGFYAPTRDAEVRAPDLELNVLDSIEDVTEKVTGAVTPGATPKQAQEARQGAVAAIEKESLAKTGLRSDVVTLYQGGQYHLYRYKKYTDVRLVFAPEFDMAFFGGYPDNFTYPRYDLDLALFRVYENGSPVRPASFFKFSPDGARENELAFVPGHPGSTQRLNTVAHLEFLRDVELPYRVARLDRTRALLRRFGAQGEEQERRAHTDLFGTENNFKRFTGMLGGLRDRAVMARKAADEQALRQAVAADPKLAEYAGAWDAVAAGRKAYAKYFLEYESVGGISSTLFGYARTLVRMAAEDAKPNAERLPEYADAARSSLELRLFSPAPVYADLEKAKLADSLAMMRESLGADHEVVRKALAGKSPEARAAELVDGSTLADPAVRRQIAKGGAKAVEASDDPMIRLARAIDPEARALRARHESDVVGVERAAYAKIARAVFATQGTKVYPDATFTLRLSFGAVKGYDENGKRVPPFTTVGGAFELSDRAGNKDPYRLPQRWLDARGRLDMATPFNLVTTNDIVGGNSGSPVINARAEVVGLVFDSNIQGLVGAYAYDDAQNRCVSVDSRGMLEALRVVYGAKEVVEELTR